MKKAPPLTSGISDPESVEKFIKSIKYPMKDLVIKIRKEILAVDPKIGECVAWNAPLFFSCADLKPFNPKEYKRYIVGFNLFKQNEIRMIFLKGSEASDPKKILEGEYGDGRRLVTLRSPSEWEKVATEFLKIVKQLHKRIKD